MLQNNIELDLKTKLIESGTTQTEVAEKVGVSLAYVNRITKGREQIVNKTFVKMMDELKSLFVFILTAAMQVVFLESETVKQLLGYDFTKSTDRASYR